MKDLTAREVGKIIKAGGKVYERKVKPTPPPGLSPSEHRAWYKRWYHEHLGFLPTTWEDAPEVSIYSGDTDES